MTVPRIDVPQETLFGFPKKIGMCASSVDGYYSVYIMPRHVSYSTMLDVTLQVELFRVLNYYYYYHNYYSSFVSMRSFKVILQLWVGNVKSVLIDFVNVRGRTFNIPNYELGMLNLFSLILWFLWFISRNLLESLVEKATENMLHTI